LTDVAVTRVLDLRTGQPTLAGPAGSRRLVDAAAWTPDAGVVLGEAAAQVLAADAGAGWLHLLPRVGDPTPCRLGPDAADAATLVARLVASAAGATGDALRVACPSGWTGQQRRALAAALTASGFPEPLLLDDVTLALGPARPDARVQLCLLDAGQLSVRSVTGTADGWTVCASADVPFGTDDLDDALIEFVAGRLGDTIPTDAAGRSALRAACSDARLRLAAEPAVEVAAAGAPPIRVLRGDLDELIGRRLDDALAMLPQGVARPEAEPERSVLAGAGAGLPTLVQALSARLGRPVTVAGEGPAAADLAGADFGPRESATPPAAQPDAGGSTPRPARAGASAFAPAPRPRRRTRYVLAAAACFLAAGGSAAALADPALRAGLLKLVAPAPAVTAAAAPILAPGGLVLSDDPGPGEASGTAGAAGTAPASASGPTADADGGTPQATAADLLAPTGALGSAGLDWPTATPTLPAPATTDPTGAAPSAPGSAAPTAVPGTTSVPATPSPTPGGTATAPTTPTPTMPSSTMPTSAPPPSTLTPTEPPSTTTEPPVTPPTTQPPVDPPTTDPPATDPPTTDPPTSEPPATDPTTDPPTTDPPTTDPPADPPTTDPPAPTDPPSTSAAAEPTPGVTSQP